jgi:N-acetylneuraminic acid mutarotase
VLKPRPSVAEKGNNGRSEAMAAEVDGIMYVLGGYIAWSPRETTDDNHLYDPGADAWLATPEDLPAAIHATHIGTTTDGEYIYMAGGYQHLCSVPSEHPGASCPDNRELALDAVRRYRPATDSWSNLPSLPAERGSGGLALLGSTLHYFGGTDSGTTNGNRVEQGDHWTLDLGDGSWENTGDPLPQARSHFGTAVLDGAIYAIGGQTGAESGANALAVVHRYANGSWTQRASLPATLSHHSSTTFVLAGHIITVGGEEGHHEPTAKVYDYSPITNDWVELTPLPVETQAAAGSLIDGVFYIAGGGGDPDFKRNLWVGSYD